MKRMLLKECEPQSDGGVPEAVWRGLEVLQQAHRYAHELKRDVWDFGIEIAELREVGLRNSDFRWLLCKGYVEHRREYSEPGDKVRQFRQDGGLIFSKQSCFVLTKEGARAAGPSTHRCADTNGAFRVSRVLTNGQSESNGANQRHVPEVPQWDRDRHELHFAGAMVKQFKLNSPNQETILMAFEEEGWPPRIDDPLRPQPEIDPKERLRNTIKSLNRKQVNRLIRFMGDGTGMAIRWESMSTEGGFDHSGRQE